MMGKRHYKFACWKLSSQLYFVLCSETSTRTTVGFKVSEAGTVEPLPRSVAMPDVRDFPIWNFQALKPVARALVRSACAAIVEDEHGYEVQLFPTPRRQAR